MTETCPSPKCLMCQREKCMACGQSNGFPLPGCQHNWLERHELPYAGLDSPTQLLPHVMRGAIEVDLADSESAAQFLEMVARVIRDRKKIRIIVE